MVNGKGGGGRVVVSLWVKNTYLNIPWLHVAEQWNENIVSLFGEGGRVNEDDLFDDDEALLLVLLLFSLLLLLFVVVVISFVSALLKKEEEDLFFAKDMRMRWLRIDENNWRFAAKTAKKKTKNTQRKGNNISPKSALWWTLLYARNRQTER